MTDRRETPRPKRPRRARSKASSTPKDWSEGERIAKYLARCGVASRRGAEELIAAGKVMVNGERLATPAVKVTGQEKITVSGKVVKRPDAPRLWRYHKPSGLITTTQDPAGRRTIFDELPKSLPRVMTVGRLDLTTEGLLLLTNDGELARALELPDNGLPRRYRARAHGRVDDERLASLAEGVTVEGVVYAPIKAELERQTGANCWINVELTEGKKREVRRALESLELTVNRLIRTAYGPFDLAELKPGAVQEISPGHWRAALDGLIPLENLPVAAPTSPFKAGAGSGKVTQNRRAKGARRSGKGSR